MYDCQRSHRSNGKHPQRKQSIKAKYWDVRCQLRNCPQIATAANRKIQRDSQDLKTALSGKATVTLQEHEVVHSLSKTANLLTYLLHGGESFLNSKPALS